MRTFSLIANALFAASIGLSVTPGFAAGEILLTHAKALAGNVTPGDAPGYPITLNQAGMYRLAGNLLAPPNRHGIVIAKPLVTIDFSGFRLAGNASASFGIIGAQHSATIRNGTITGFGASGIRGTGSFWMIKNMRVIFNRASGIDCGVACLVEGSVISRNTGNGINIASGAVIANTFAENSGFALNGTGAGVGYAHNLFSRNTGGVFDQVDGAAVAMHTNVCRELGGPLESC